ncbi:MAG: DUF234 domain-containing protein, partial [Egibacteraceae bacterium]
EALGLIDRLTPVGEDPRRTKRVRYEVRDPFLRLWLAVVVPNREAFELGRGASVLAAVRDQVAASHHHAFAAVVRDWLAEREQATCGPWWPTAAGDGVDVLALRGAHAVAAASVFWATGVDGQAERSQLRKVLEACPHARADTLHVVARSGSQVTDPASLYDDCHGTSSKT